MTYFYFQKFDGKLNAGKIFSDIDPNRISFETMDGKSRMQIEKERITKTFESFSCWRCWDLKEVHTPISKQYFPCPACSWRK